MSKHTKDALLRRLEIALRDMYHNATPHFPRFATTKLDDEYMREFYDAAAQEIAYIMDGLGSCAASWKREIKLGFTHNERYFWLVSRITEFGDLYQWGRGGRTLAPFKLINQRGGSSFSICSAENYSDRSNESLTDMIQVIEAFNRYVHQWNSRDNLQQLWRDYCSDRRAELATDAKETRKDLKRLARDAAALKDAPESVCNVIKAEIQRLREAHKSTVQRLAAYQAELAA